MDQSWMQNGGIVIVGLGPGEANLLTREAWDWLCQIPRVYVRTRHHPTVAGFPEGVEVVSFDDLYDQGEAFEQVYAGIVDEILRLGQQPGGVTYAVPGHPYVAEATSPEIARRARELGLEVRVVEGVSFLEPTFTALELDPYPRLALVDALELGPAHMPGFPPDTPALVAQIYSRQVAAEVKLTLSAVYPDTHPVRLVHAAGSPRQKVEDLPLYEIDRSAYVGLLTSLYVPPLEANTSFEGFQDIIARLRAPDGCPWDQKQTHQTLRSHLLQETYETLEAIDNDDPQEMCEEFGDLLLQIVLHAQIGSEYGEFSMAEVIRGISEKIIRRHPHVFGETAVEGVGEVLSNWEKIKEAERAANGTAETKGLLDGLPQALPGLNLAHEIQDRAARVGFDWETIDPVVAKVREELEEVLSAPEEKREGELGDLLFAVVNLARWYKVDPENALRQTNRRFRQRFAHIEKRAREAGRSLIEMTLAEMDAWWDEAKRLE